MTLQEFDTIKTLIENAQCLDNLIEREWFPEEIENSEFPNVRDRLRDGENLINLYIDLWDYIQSQIAGASEDFDRDSFVEIQKTIFWELAWQELNDEDKPKP